MSLKMLWKRWQGQFNERSRRERGLIAATLILGLALIGSTVFVEPRFARLAMDKRSLEALQTENQNLQAQMQIMQPRLKEDPDAAAKRELEVLRAKLAALNGELAKANAALVPASEMNARLERLLSRQPGLRLLSLRTLPPSSFVERKVEAAAGEAKGDAAAGDFDLYRHGVEIKLVGSYADLSAYVAQLEGDKQKFIWGEARLNVVEYPKATLTLVLYTLSLDKAWLSL